MSSKRFGYREDGTLGYCRALPENIGKGNCKHAEHIEVTEEQIVSGFLKQHNEQAIESYLAANGVDSLPPKLSKTEQRALREKPVFTPEELRAQADEVAAQLRLEDFKSIQNFFDEYQRAMTSEELRDQLGWDAEKHLLAYMKSDAPAAVRLREYLGTKAELEALSEILYTNVGAMTKAPRWSSSGRVSIPRVIMSSIDNDMSKENYVASVLFFKGRCCYCNRTLNLDGEYQTVPSGEHITPIWPDDEKAPLGATRYGNMALACKRCNVSRGSRNLEDWLNTNRVIKKEEKVKALARIKAFREYASYQDYTKAESNRFRAAIARVQKLVDVSRDDTGRIIRGEGHGDIIRAALAREKTRLSPRKTGV